MRKLNQLAALALIGIFALTSCGGSKSKGISQANPTAAKPTIIAPAPVIKTTLKGKVIDYTNKAPVPNAKLITFDKQEVTSTDKGEFTLQVPQDKGFTFRVKALGYQETLAGGRIKAATSGVEVKLAKLNSGIFPITLNIGDKGAKLFKGPIVPKGIEITQGKLYQIAIPKVRITKFTGVNKPIALSYFDVHKTHTWQYVLVNSDGTIKSGGDWLRSNRAYFLLGTDSAILDCDGDCFTASNTALILGGDTSDPDQNWNLVGCPYEEAFPLSYCNIGLGYNYYTFEEAYNNNLTGPAVFYHYNGDTGNWEEVSCPYGMIEPNKGYYFLSLRNCHIDLTRIPPNPEADNVLKQLATALKSNDIEAALDLFLEMDRAKMREHFASLTSQELYELGQAVEGATLDDNTERERSYWVTLMMRGKPSLYRIVINNYPGTWTIIEFQ